MNDKQIEQRYFEILMAIQSQKIPVAALWQFRRDNGITTPLTQDSRYGRACSRRTEATKGMKHGVDLFAV